MALERDEGWRALQSGNISEAIVQLEQACTADSSDLDAHLFLAAAYGKAGRHAEAIQAALRAVQIQPANAQARFNLGVALENGDHAAEALQAFEQAILLNPDYARAKEAVQRLRPNPTSSSSYSPQVYSPAPPPPAPEPALPAAGLAEPIPRTEQMPATPPDVTQAWRPEPPSIGYEAAHRPTTQALPSHGLLNDYSPSPNTERGPAPGIEPMPDSLPPPNYRDEFDIPEGLRNLRDILIRPWTFFQSQRGAHGLMSPLVMVCLYMALYAITTILSSVTRGIFVALIAVITVPFSVLFSGIALMLGYLFQALFVHVIGWCFGNRQDFSCSVRACVFSNAPQYVMGLVISLIMSISMTAMISRSSFSKQDIGEMLGMTPAQVAAMDSSGNFSTTNTTPSTFTTTQTVRGRLGSKITIKRSLPGDWQPSIDTPVRVIGFVWRRFGVPIAVLMSLSAISWFWSTVLLVVAIHHHQQIAVWKAFCVVGIIYLLSLIILIGIFLLLKSLILWALAAAAHSGPAYNVGGTPN